MLKKFYFRVLNSFKNRLGLNELIQSNKEIINAIKHKTNQELVKANNENNRLNQEIIKILKNQQADLSHLSRKQFLVSNGNVWQFLNGVKIHLPYYPWDFIQKTIGNTNDFYERDILRSLNHYLPTNATILDIGANIGNHSLYWASANARQIFAFEPVPDTFTWLTKNIEINNFGEIITAFNFGLGNVTSNVEVLDNFANNIGGTSIKTTEIQNRNALRIKRLDDLDLNVDKIDFIKSDTEGFELEVLAGGRNTIAKHRPILFVETTTKQSLPSLKCDDTAPQVKDFLIKLDYQEPIIFPDRNLLFLP
jgi:FkbM family methyltransferase